MVVPTYVTKYAANDKGDINVYSTREPTGATIERVFRTWQCRCGAKAVSDYTPGACGMAKCR